MLFYNSKSTDPYYNLALEEYVFTRLPKGEKIFMLWQNNNTIVIGKNQNTVQEINQQFVKKNGIVVARRITGGGAVYHDLGNLNFTFIEEHGEKQGIDFSVYAAPVIKALKSFGIEAELTGRNDLLIGGRKFSGNAQTIKNGVVLHHGTLLFDSDLEFVKDALMVREDKIKSKGIASVRSRVTNIKEHLREEITLQDFWKRLAGEVLCTKDAKPLELSEEDLQQICRLRDEKYATWEWNYGNSPQYEIERYRRFSCGGLTVMMDVGRGGIVQNIKISGDFFGNRDVCELEQSLKGVRLMRDELFEKVSQMDLMEYIAGMSVEEFVDFLCPLNS